MTEWQRLGDNKSWDNVDLKQEKRGWVHLRDLRTRDFLELSSEAVDDLAAHSNAVKALVEANAESSLIADEAIASTLDQLKERHGLSSGLCILADELRKRTQRRRAALASFTEVGDG